MTSLGTLNTKFAINELSFSLVTHMVYSDPRFDSYGLLQSGYGAEYFLDRLSIQVNDQVLSHKKHESCWGLNTDYVDNMLSFPTPTHTHIFSNHSNGYGHLKTAPYGVQQIAGNWFSQWVEALTRFRTAVRL
jgi:hypothetical protein